MLERETATDLRHSWELHCQYPDPVLANPDDQAMWKQLEDISKQVSGMLTVTEHVCFCYQFIDAILLLVCMFV